MLIDSQEILGAQILIVDDQAANVQRLEHLLDLQMPVMDGSQQQFRVSGEPMFSHTCGFIGYRGIGLEVTANK